VNPSDSTDSLELYRWAVQDPETHAVLLRIMFDRLGSDGPAEVLREDFAGTAADAVAWVALKPGRRAIAIDRDPATVEWARARAGRLLEDCAPRVRFFNRDVFELEHSEEVPHADILSVLNFSVMYLHDLALLDRYLRVARAGLRRGGIFVCNLFGGPDRSRPHRQSTRISPQPRLPREDAPADFDYIWEVRSVDPIDRVADCRVHFVLGDAEMDADRVERRDVFRYAFRLWSPQDVCGALERAGFVSTHIWQHTVQPHAGTARPMLCPVTPEQLSRQVAWTAYLIGVA
jgi:SAM-dependent methyltransferase